MRPDRGRNRSAAVAADSSPGEWARRMRLGDAAAVDHVRARVRKILASKRLRIPVQDREDLEQEVMTEVWQAVNRPGFDFTAGFWGFVEVVTSRRCIDWLRSRKVPLPLSENLLDSGRNPLQKTLDNERTDLAEKVLAALDPDCRKLILLRLREGFSYSAIARNLGKTEGALRVQMYRCIRVAQQLLGDSQAEAVKGRFGNGPHGSS
jgi:RNA polymerase sigma factor (sigma-70 family)